MFTQARMGNNKEKNEQLDQEDVKPFSQISNQVPFLKGT